MSLFHQIRPKKKIWIWCLWVSDLMSCDKAVFVRISWWLLPNQRLQTKPCVSVTWGCCTPSIIFNKATISEVKILTSLSGCDCQLTMFKVTLNDWHLVQSYICILLFHSTDANGSRTRGSFHNNVPKNDSPPCTMINLPSLWDEITCCVSSWGRVRRSDYQAMHQIFDYLQGMLITPLLDFSVTPAINPRHSLAWWNCRTLLNVINSHDRFWTSLHWVLWSREITSGYSEYLMDPRVSINVEKLFIVLSFHVH